MSIQAAIFIPVVLVLRLETSREKLLGTCRMTGKGKDVGELILLCALAVGVSLSNTFEVAVISLEIWLVLLHKIPSEFCRLLQVNIYFNYKKGLLLNIFSC